MKDAVVMRTQRAFCVTRSTPVRTDPQMQASEARNQTRDDGWARRSDFKNVGSFGPHEYENDHHTEDDVQQSQFDNVEVPDADVQIEPNPLQVFHDEEDQQRNSATAGRKLHDSVDRAPHR